MKNFYLVNRSQDVISLLSGLKSRITSIKPALALLALLTVGAWSVPAWGKTWTWTVKVGVASGSGTAYAEIFKSGAFGIGGSVNKTTAEATSTTLQTTSDSQDSRYSSSNYYRHYIFHATASAGYTFAGWYTGTDVSGTASSTSNPLTGENDNDGFTETRYAKFTANQYKITFNKQEGTGGTDNATVNFDNNNYSVSPVAVPTRTGYTFGGYYTAKNGGGVQIVNASGVWQKDKTNYLDANGKWIKAADTEVYAKWTANTYYVYFNGNGATSGSMDDQAFTFNAAAKALSEFTNFVREYTVTYDATDGAVVANAPSPTARYEYVNWNTEADGTGTFYNNKANMQITGSNPSDVTLYAQWKSKAVTLPNATKEGGVLDAWYLGDTRIGAAGESYTPTANVTLTAHWINKYTPEFGGSNHSMEVTDQWTNAFTFKYTSNPTVHISPAGIISYDAKNNIVTGVSEGTATIYFTQDETDQLFSGESYHWTITVSRKNNTLALTSTSAEKYVDEEVTGIITTKNSNATVQTSSSDATIAYYDVEKNKIVIPNSAAKSFANTTVTIDIWQDKNVTYKASDVLTFTLTVKKYPALFTGSGYNLMVDGTQTADYGYTNTSAAQPTANSADAFYYTIDDESLSTSVNKGTSVVTFNPANKQITACNAGTAKITLHQEETYKHTAAEKSFNVEVYKYNSVFANTSTVNVKVEESKTSPYTLTYVKPDNSYISTESLTVGTPSLNSGEYYYTIKHNVTTSNTTGSSDNTKVIEYTAGTKNVTGKNAGTATVYLHQTETYKYNSADANFIVAVTKNDPVFTWNSQNKPYYHNTNIADIFSSTNKDCAYTIGESSDALVARVDDNTLKVLTKDGSASFEVNQAANYKWNGKEQTFTVTPVYQSNHVPFTISSSNEGTFRVSKTSNTSWDSNGYKMGEGGWTRKDANVIIAFTGIPDKLTFTKVCDRWGLNLPATGDCLFEVYESATNGNWGDPIWSYNTKEESRDVTDVPQLKSTTRYIKLRYYGSVYGHFNNIKVTERHTFAANTDKLDFGQKEVNDEVTPLTFGLNYANAGHNITLTTNDSKFTVNPTTITSIGGEKADTFTPISVSYNTASEHTSSNAKLTIQDELGNKTTVNLIGKTVKRTPTVTWSSDADYFNVDDVLSATNVNGLTVTLSGNTDYVHCEGNAATMLAATTGTITITAHVTGNDIYADADITKTITITNKEKQYITWDQDFSRLKTTDGTKSITLNATATSGLAVSYELSGDKTGLNLTQNGNIWTLTYSAKECKNTTIIAKQAGNGTYAPASSVAKAVKVIDPTKVCDTNETLVNSTVTLKDQSTTYNIDIPSTMTINVSRTKTSWALYLNGFKVELYSGRNGTGSKLHEYSYGADEINTSKTISLSGLNIAAKSVKLISEASNGYNVTSVTYTKRKYCTISTNSLNFSTYPNTQAAAQSFNVEYANYPISLECSNAKFAFTPMQGFGDCSEYGTQQVSVQYTAGAEEGEDVGYLYIKDNTGATLKTCTLNVTISKVAQSIKTTNIQNSYLTTDKVTLTAEANSSLTEFTYSASPAGIASFNGAEMTFAKSGTIAITVNQAGNNVYNSTSTTVENVVVSKATPDIATSPTGTSIAYNQTLNNSTLSGGAAEVTFRGKAHTAVEGTFAWTNPLQQIAENTGVHNYSVTFTPTNSAMYTTTEFTIPISVSRLEQGIIMNNGTVKVAVEGIDAGSADSKLDLDDLIKWQTTDVVDEVERTGSVSYAVISENKGNATIGVGNIFSATQTGEYTIRATKAQTDYYAEATTDFTVTVGKRANTLAVSGAAFEKYVEEEITAIRSQQNSDAEVKTSSTSPTIAYYDVDQNKIVIPNSVSEEQMFGSQKTVTITIWQDETERFEASGVKTITLTVKKYETTITGSDYILKVNGTKTANYAFANTSTQFPSSNLSAEFYYTIDEPNYENAELNNGEGLITFNPSTNVITGLNAGTTKITFYQKETYKYTGASLLCNIAVEKKENVISNTWNVWQKDLKESTTKAVSFSSTHGDYEHYPIGIERVYGEDVAVLSGTAEGASITTNTTKGYAIWHFSQAENYEYYAAEADLMVTVGVPAPPTCYVYEDDTEHEFMTHITDAEGHFETPIAINSPIDKIWYSAKKSSAGYNYFVVQYSTDNGTTWSTVSSPDLGDSYADYSASFPTMSGNKKITHVRFGAKTGATLSKWYKNVKISRRAHFNIQDAEQKNISSLPTMICTIDETSTATAKFYIDYSTCADEIQIQSSNPEHFTVSRTTIDVSEKHDNLTSAKEEITVTYNSAALGTHSSVITISTSYQTRALSVSGETTKRTPTIIWQEGYINNPLTLPIGQIANAIKPAAIATSTAQVMYESSNENVVQITESGYAFKVIGLGDATLTAISPENDKWKRVSDTRVIHASEKTVQEIVWNQSFPRFMKPNEDVIDLEAQVFLHNISTGTLNYSAERTQYISYSCPVNSVVSIAGNKMTILNYGEVKVTASVGGNDDYEAATPVTILINVRQPSAGCETPLVLNKTDVIDMFEVNVDFSDYSHLTTQEMISSEIKINHANGKPDKLSFSYEGEEYAFGLIKFFGGYIKFEQFDGTEWKAVEGSRVETEKNAWNTKSNLQLDENATALRIIRETGSTGHHYIKDIQVTRTQYLRATETEIDLGEIAYGQATPVTIGFDYSDVKGDLTAHTINETTDLTISNNGAIDLACGSFGHYDLQTTFTPSQAGDWTGTVEVYDPITNLSFTVVLTATVAANEGYVYEQEGLWSQTGKWSISVLPDSTRNVTIAQNVTIDITANVKSMTINEGVTVTVKSGVTVKIGNGTPQTKSSGTYGNLYVEDGAQVLLAEGATLNVNNFSLEASLSGNGERASSGQVTNDHDQLNVAGDAYFQLKLNSTGTNTLGWYDFVVPFEVNISNGISIVDNDGVLHSARYGEDYLVMRYDEAKRAVNGKDWIKYNGIMIPGRVYTIAVDADHPEWNTVRFKKMKDATVGAPATYQAECSTTGDAKDCGWNGIGNGTLQHMQLSDASVKIQVYDHENNIFEIRDEAEVEKMKFAVGTSFFMQVDEEKPIGFTPATGGHVFLAPAREPRGVEEFRLSLTAEGATNFSDRLWVSASEDAYADYTVGHDLLKMGEPDEAKTARMWAVRGNMRLCDIEMLMHNYSASCPINFQAPNEGTYVLAVEQAPTDATLYLTKDGRVMWNLSMSPYEIDLQKGRTEGYGLRIVADRQTATGIENEGMLNSEDGVRKVLIDDMIYMITPEGAMYDATGKKLQ